MNIPPAVTAVSFLRKRHAFGPTEGSLMGSCASIAVMRSPLGVVVVIPVWPGPLLHEKVFEMLTLAQLLLHDDQQEVGMSTQRTYGSGLIRDVELLEVLARPEAGAAGLGVSRIADIAGRDKAQVSRALATLSEAGLVTRDEDTRAYRPGWRLFALATQASETH